MPGNTSSSSFLGRLSTSTRSSFMSSKEVRCNVHLLHDSDIVTNEFTRSQPAQNVLDYVCGLKNIQENDFLGLRYQDHNKHRYWLDLSRSIGHVTKQFKTENLTLHLRFRYYPSDPTRIHDLNLRYQLFVQLQRDLLHGRLYCPQTQAAELAALILQAQIGDYDENNHPNNYVSGYKLLLRQTPKLEEKIAVLHKEMKGKSSSDAELEFLEKASQLDTYAFDPYCIKDPHDSTNAVYVGASAKGILIYNGTNRTHYIDWSELTKVDYSGRELRIIVSDTYQPPTISQNNKFGHTNGSPTSGASAMDKLVPKKGALTLKYICPSGQFAKHLWIHILSQQAFFNELSAQNVKPKFSKPRIPLLSRGSTFRFPSKRVYREIEEHLSESESRFNQTIIDSNGNPSRDQTYDNESAFNTSTASVPVIRYELPRQEPRHDQPWLNKATTTQLSNDIRSADVADLSPTKEDEQNQNNNKWNSKNLNISFLPTIDNAKEIETPSGSEEVMVPKIIHTIQKSDNKSTSFTVHLVKRESSRSQSPDASLYESRTDILEHEFINNVENGILFGEPLASSTPRSNKTTFGTNEQGNGIKMFEEKINSKSNGNSKCVANKNEKTILKRFTNGLFVTFLFFILTLAVVIFIFEKSEGSSNDWIEQNKQLSDMRHIYYEPTRNYVIHQYHKYFNSKKFDRI